jgi:hypothetical protein
MAVYRTGQSLDCCFRSDRTQHFGGRYCNGRHTGHMCDSIGHYQKRTSPARQPPSRLHKSRRRYTRTGELGLDGNTFVPPRKDSSDNDESTMASTRRTRPSPPVLAKPPLPPMASFPTSWFCWGDLSWLHHLVCFFPFFPDSNLSTYIFLSCTYPYPFACRELKAPRILPCDPVPP